MQSKKITNYTVYTTTKGVVHDGFWVTVLRNVTIWYNLWRFSSYCHGLGIGSFCLHQWALVLWQNFCDRRNMQHKTSWIGWNNCDEYNSSFCSAVMQKIGPNNQLWANQDNLGPCMLSINLKKTGYSAPRMVRTQNLGVLALTFYHYATASVLIEVDTFL